MLIEAGLLSPAMMLSNRPISGLLPSMNRDPINIDIDDLHHMALEANERKNDKGKDTLKDPPIFIRGATIAVQQEDWGYVDLWCDSQA